MYYKIKQETMIKILNYLSNRPWREVNDLISEVHVSEFVDTSKKKRKKSLDSSKD